MSPPGGNRRSPRRRQCSHMSHGASLGSCSPSGGVWTSWQLALYLLGLDESIARSSLGRWNRSVPNRGGMPEKHEMRQNRNRCTPWDKLKKQRHTMAWKMNSILLLKAIEPENHLPS